MAVKKRGLGRGLEALLGGALEDGDQAPELRRLPIEALRPGSAQPRHGVSSEGLQELAESIRAQGLVQPIVARPHADGGYEIVAGERRWRAAQLAGLDEVPVLVRALDEREAVAIALIENIQREDLNPLEEAGALRRLVDDFGMTHQQVAAAVGRSRAAVSNLLRLLELEPKVQQLLREGRLEMGHGRALLALKGALQLEAAQQVVLRGLSVRETEALVRRMLAGEPRRRRLQPDPNIRALEEDLSLRLGAKVQLQHQASGKGRLVIHYSSLDELDGILSHVK